MKRFSLLFTNIIIAQFRSESDYGALFGLVLPIQIYKPLKIEQHVGGEYAEGFLAERT